jgi:hypothetical protein
MKDIANLADFVQAGDDVLGLYVTRYFHSDVQCIGIIIGRPSPYFVLVAPIYSVIVSPLKYEVGGFSAICTNLFEQKWEYKIADEPPFRLRVSSRLFRNHSFDLTPYTFYDYNF